VAGLIPEGTGVGAVGLWLGEAVAEAAVATGTATAAAPMSTPVVSRAIVLRIMSCAPP
jgi:hypothetical protein